MIIDFRVRPPYGNFLNAFVYTDSKKVDDVAKNVERFGNHSSVAAKEQSMEKFIQEMDEYGISKAVVHVQVRKGRPIANEEALYLANEYPDHLLCLAGIDPSDTKKALSIIDTYVLQGKCIGINMEQAMIAEPMYITDERLYPIYEKCEQEDILLATNFGGCFAPGLKYYNPLHLDEVARTFPKLRLGVCHGGWPFVTEACQIALENENVYLAPEAYMIHSPGGNDFVVAANYLLQDKIMLGTAYPCVSYVDFLEAYRKSGLHADVWDKVMGLNAAKLLKLE